jgi:DNA replication protein DnaC
MWKAYSHRWNREVIQRYELESLYHARDVFHRYFNWHNTKKRGYGQEAQVDFGVYKMKDKEGKRIKVWFFVMVLSRSRQKYIYFQNHPFTTATAIQAHQRAFIYFQGVPHKIIYDQDRVFMVDENLGDLLLTSGFEHYVRGESFEAIFCRKADPQSKGKVENVVKYVKYNFLQGRIFSGIDNLNESALGWLMRTGNGKKHATTRLIPHQEWLKEKNYLLPIRKQMLIDLPEFISYKVRKDNTISYKGNYYSLPLGTYKNQESSVLVRVDESNLNLYDLQKNLLAVHTISILKGRLIIISDHKRDKSKNLEQRKQEVIERLGETEMAHEFIEALARSKPRYLNDNLRTLLSKLKTPEQAILNQALDYCLNNQVYNAMRFIEIINHYQGLEVTEKHQAHLSSQTHLNSYTLPKQAHQVPETSQINIYQKILSHMIKDIEIIREYADVLRLTQLKKEPEKLLHQAQIDKPTYIEFTHLLLEREIMQRQKTDFERRMIMARLPKDSNLDQWDYNHANGLGKQQLKELRQLLWLEQNYNIVLMGPSGTGKTFLASGLILDAVKNGYRAYFKTMEEIISMLRLKEMTTSAMNGYNRLIKAHLIAIDDIMLFPMKRNEAVAFFNLINLLHHLLLTLKMSEAKIVNDKQVCFRDLLQEFIDAAIHTCHLGFDQ